MHINPAFNSLYLGTTLLRCGSWFAVEARNASQVILKETETGNFEMLSPEQFSKELLDGDIQIGSKKDSAVTLDRIERLLFEDLDCRTASEKAKASRQAKYVLRYLNDRPLTRSAVQQMISLEAERLGDLQPPCIASLYNWRNRVQAAGGRTIVLASVSGRRKGQITLHPAMVRLMDEVLFEHHFKQDGDNLSVATDKLNERIKKHSETAAPEDRLKPINRTTFLRYRNKAYHPYDIYRMRFGKAAADQWWRTNRRGPRPERALEKVQIDSTLVDIILVDSKGRILGRPWATVAIDVYSRVILAIVIGYAPPSLETVTQCLRLMCMPKDDLVTQYGLKNGLYFGLPSEVVVDNALEFHSNYLREEVPERLRIQVTYQPKGEPWWKPMVERWFRTWQDARVHNLPGTTQSNTTKRGDYDSEGNAKITLEEFRKLTWRWIDLYHHDWHAELGDTPAHAFAESPEGPGRVLSSIKDLDFLLQPAAKPKPIASKGIVLHGLWYDSDELKALRPPPGEERKFEVRYDPADLGAIFVIGGGLTRYLRVEAVWREYADGLSLYQHEQIRKELREREHEAVNEEDYLVALGCLIEAEQALLDKRTTTGRRGKARLMNLTSEAAKISQASRAATQKASECPPEQDPVDETKSYSPSNAEVPEGGAVPAKVTIRKAPLPTSRVSKKSKAAKPKGEGGAKKLRGPKKAVPEPEKSQDITTEPDDLDARLDDMSTLQKED